MAVGQARGVILLSIAAHGIEIAEFTPLQVKQSVVGYGKATKDQVMYMTQRLLSLEEKPQLDDAADALARVERAVGVLEYHLKIAPCGLQCFG